MQGRLHSSFQQGQWSINSYLDSEELTSTLCPFKKVSIKKQPRARLGSLDNLEHWLFHITCSNSRNCRKSRVYTHEVGFLGLSRSMEPVGLWQRRQNWQCRQAKEKAWQKCSHQISLNSLTHPKTSLYQFACFAPALQEFSLIQMIQAQVLSFLTNFPTFPSEKILEMIENQIKKRISIIMTSVWY